LRVIHIRGEGDDFCAGADLDKLVARSMEKALTLPASRPSYRDSSFTA